MDEPRHGTVACPVSVGATATVTGGFGSVPDLEPALREAPRAAARQLYARAFAALRDGWPGAHRPRFTAPRGRTLQWLTPFGPVDLPVRLVREKASGRYLTFSKVFLRPKATRLLSPALEQAACAAVTEQNDRPAARALSRGIGARLGPWRVWACGPYPGARRLLEQEKAPPPPARPVNVPALLSEVDSTWLKAQQRRRQGPVRHFQVHLGLHYTGRTPPRPRQARLGRRREKHRSAHQPPLPTPGPELESPPRRTAAPPPTTPGPARRLERLVEIPTPIPPPTPPALIAPQLTVDEHYPDAAQGVK